MNARVRPSGSPSDARSGFALAVTLLVMAVAIGAFVTAASVSMIGARRGASGELAAYQALRVAENAVNTFPANLIAAKYEGPMSAAAINAWIDAESRQDLLVYTDGAGIADITVLPGGGASSATLRAASEVPGAVKVVLRDVESMPPGRLNPPILNAPLLSVPPADIRGAAVIRGADYLDPTNDGSVSIGPFTAGAIGDPITLESPRAFLAQPGFYVAVGDSRFRVIGVDGTTLEVTEVTSGDIPITQAELDDLDGDAMRLIPAAVGQGEVTGTGSRFIVPLSFSNAVREQYCVRVDTGDGNTYTARVVELLDDGDSAELDFSGCETHNGVPSVIPESSALITDVVSAESAGNITSPGGGQDRLPNGTRTGSDSWLYEFRELEDRERLFEATFGITREQFRQLAEDAPQPENSGVIPKALKDQRYDGLTYSTGGAENKAFCGAGFMVIDGDVSFTAGQGAFQGECAGETGFSGIVYITGDFRHQGNSVFAGSVIVQGTTYIDDEAVEVGDDTFVGGTGQAEDKIRYDLAAILEASRLVTVPGGQGWVLGTWRQE